nr:reverse transcriptase domain-containing protein [Tanacetum cinerariifolium]
MKEQAYNVDTDEDKSLTTTTISMNSRSSASMNSLRGKLSRSDPTLLNNSEIAAEGPGDLPVPDLWAMEELCQQSLNGWVGPIAPISIQATNFGLKNDMIQQVQNSCQFHGLPGDDANKHLDKFLHVTQSIKVNRVTDDALRLYLFPYSLTHHDTAWFDCLPRNSINTFEQMAKMFLEKYFPPSMVTKLINEITNFRQRPNESLFEAWGCYKLSIDRCPNHNMLPVNQIDTFYNGLTLRHRDTTNAAAGGTFMKRHPEECYDLIKNMTAHHNDWDTSAQRSESSSSITSSSDTEIAALKSEMAKINKNLMRILQVNQQVKAVTPNCETCGGPRSFSDYPATVGNTQNVYAAGAYQGASHGQNQPPAYQALVYQALVHQPQIPQPQFMKMNTVSPSGSGTLPSNTTTNPKEDLKGITTHSGTAYQRPTIPTSSSSPVVECETEATKDMVHPTNNRGTKDVQPSVVPTESPILNSEPVVTPIIEPVASPVSAPRPNQRPSIPYPSRLYDQKLRDKPNNQREKFFQIFKDLNFNISFSDALILMPKFGPSIKSLLTNKDKLCELARTPLNEHCSTVLLKKLPEKLRDPDKFLIQCDFPGMAKCLASADLGASINLMALSVRNKLSLPDLSPTCMTLELADRSISHPVGVAKDVFVKVGTFHFPTNFVSVDFDADPRVPLIPGRSFLKTGRALIDIFEGELTLRVGKEAITFNLDQTSRYSANYNDMTANRIDIIDMACDECSQEVLGFFDVIASGNPTPYYDAIVSTTSPTLTPFRESDFLLEEVDAFLAIEDDPTSPEVDESYVDTEGDILLLEAFLNDDPSLPPPNQGNYLPEFRKELKICEAKSNKSSIDEPTEVELKDLPPHLEYAFLEGDDKLPVIIAKDLSVEEKTALITEDFKPAVQHQRRVNPKIHDVIKNEVLKLLDVGLIYPISDSPWVSPVHYVPKKGGFTVVENEENELISTRLVTGWHVCIDYRKLNEATRKDHFPLPFMDQMLERLAGNLYYYFLYSFSGWTSSSLEESKEYTWSSKGQELEATGIMPARMMVEYILHQAQEQDLDQASGTKMKTRCLTSMGDEHLDTIPATELDEFIKSCVENLVPNPSESKGENGCDVPSCFTTFSNIIFDDEYGFDSVDDQSLHNEDFSEKIFSNPLFEEEIISIKKNQHHFNAESDIVESMLNRNSSIISSSSKIDSLLDEFAGELTLLKSIPPGIDKTDCHPENEIFLSQRLLYNNSSPRPPKEFNSENSYAEIESFSPSPILIKDSDSFMEEIDLFLTPDDPMPPSIEDDEDSEGDILFLERLLHDDPIPLPDILDFSYEVRIFLPFFTYPVTSPVLLSFGSEDKIFDPGITINRSYSF